jgi:hypothetical protein
MKKTIYVIAILFSFSIGLNQPFGFVKEKTEQSAAISTVTTHSLL